MKILAAAKASLVFIKNRCRSSRSQMFFKIGVLKISQNSQENSLLESLFNRVASLELFSCEYCESFKSSFFIEHLRWLFQHMFCFTLYFQEDIAKYIVVIHCIIVSFWNLKSLSLSFAFIRFVVTRCHSLYHSLSFFATRYHSLSLVVTCCTTRYYSLYMSWYLFLVPLGGQNIIWIFSNLGCPNW